MERPTVEVYEQRAGDWQVKRPPGNREDAVALSRRALAHAPLLDAGSGPGSYLPDLRRPTVALDAAFAMVALARDTAPEVPAVVGDLEALPFRRGAFGGAWGRASYLHIRKTRLPMALARLHDALVVGAPIHLTLREGEGEGPLDNDDFAGRFFARWQAAELAGVATGAGFEIDAVVTEGQWVRLDATRARTLPDFVGPGMRVLTCGLNPSLVAADAGYGYAGPSNRFWKAMTAAGLITRGRDPWHALAVDRVGMTCMVKRATPRSSDLGKDEYRAGAARVAQLVSWLRPAVVLFVGLEGWRAAVDPKAVAGRQAQPFGGAAAYVMPSTSGLNAHASLDMLVDHVRRAMLIAGSAERSPDPSAAASSPPTANPAAG